MDEVLQGDSRWPHVAGGSVQVVQERELPLFLEHAHARERSFIELGELAENAVGTLHELRRVDASSNRDDEGDQNAGYRRVDARGENSRPHTDRQQDVDPGTTQVGAVRREEKEQEHTRHGQGHQPHLLRIEDGDDQHGTDVVGNRECGQEHLEADR